MSKPRPPWYDPHVGPMSDDPTRVKRPRARPRTHDERPCLDVVRGQAQDEVLWLDGPSVVLGRGSDGGITLDDDGVSRRHAKVILNDDGIVNLKDLGSTNGTYVNGAPINATVLREGDLIQLGPDVTLRFGYRSPADAPARPAPQWELSAREMQIAALVADGLTNRQIGERLHISRHTVVSHLSNVFERVGVTSRAALAKLVAERRVRGPS
jgi:DNA-binding CsgD family transcriptional regulator